MVSSSNVHPDGSLTLPPPEKSGWCIIPVFWASAPKKVATEDEDEDEEEDRLSSEGVEGVGPRKLMRENRSMLQWTQMSASLGRQPARRREPHQKHAPKVRIRGTCDGTFKLHHRMIHVLLELNVYRI